MKQLRKLLQFSRFYFGIFSTYPVSQRKKEGLGLQYNSNLIFLYYYLFFPIFFNLVIIIWSLF